jgi:hypothetical protein
MGLLESDDLAYMRECLGDIETDVEEPIVYKRYLSTTAGDPVMGTSDTPVYDDTEITASVRTLTLEEIQVSGGVYVLGDVEFEIRLQETIFETAPVYVDRIVYAGATYKPKKIDPVQLGGLIGWTVKAGKK